MDIFSNRELSMIIWLTVLVVFLFTAKGTRGSVVRFLKQLFSGQLTIIYGLMIVYISATVYALYLCNWWNMGQLKNTIFWTLFVAAPTLLEAKKAHTKDFFLRAVFDIFKFTALLEFLLSVYSFNFLTELFIIPIAFFLTYTFAFSKRDEKNAAVTNVLSGLLSFAGLTLIIYFVYRFISDYSTFINVDTFNDFFIPTALTLLFFPFMFGLSIYMNFEYSFIILRRAVRNKDLHPYMECMAIRHFIFRIKLLDRWRTSLLLKRADTKEDIRNSIKELKKMIKIEKNPPPVPKELGWSPYLAKDFLIDQGLPTRNYLNDYQDEWFACSDYLKLTDDFNANNIAYYVTGTRDLATELKIVINLHDLSQARAAHEKLKSAASTLYFSALNLEMGEEWKMAIENGKNATIQNNGKEIKVNKMPWVEAINKGYSLSFSIKHVQ